MLFRAGIHAFAVDLPGAAPAVASLIDGRRQRYRSMAQAEGDAQDAPCQPGARA
jgi:hypothetical protein